MLFRSPASSTDAATVYGTATAETVIVESGASVSFNAFGSDDTLQIQGSSADYSIHSAGATVYLTHSDGSVISLAAGLAATHVQFSNGSADLLIEPGAGIKLGEQLISGDSQAIDMTSNGNTLSADQGTAAAAINLDASGGDFILLDDASAQGSVVVTGFAAGDSIQVSNASAGDYSFANNGTDVSISFNNNSTLNSITLTGVVSSDDLVYNEATFEAAVGFDAFILL